jgi:hypothetical protein
MLCLLRCLLEGGFPLFTELPRARLLGNSEGLAAAGFVPRGNLLWEAKRAIKRRTELTTPDVLDEEEVRSEAKLWRSVGQGIGNAIHYLEKRWVFDDEGEELLEELRAIDDKVGQLVRKVGQAEQRSRDVA